KYGAGITRNREGWMERRNIPQPLIKNHPGLYALYICTQIYVKIHAAEMHFVSFYGN
uniref:Uncharacterized protein n=1 Tax=Parascaris univalens TaxID=6257 RepID=A0A914ZTF9_PARUN